MAQPAISSIAAAVQEASEAGATTTSSFHAVQMERSQRSPRFKQVVEPPAVEIESDSDVDDASDVEPEPCSEAKLAAQRKSARDEAFWTVAQLALHERERRERVGAFLREYGFADVNAKKGWWNYTYPLHVAAELGDARLVQFLLDSRAMRRRRDSSGRTARQLTKKVNQQGSHDAVIRVLKLSQRRLRREKPGLRSVQASFIAISSAAAPLASPPAEVELVQATSIAVRVMVPPSPILSGGAPIAPLPVASGRPPAMILGKQDSECGDKQRAARGGA